MSVRGRQVLVIGGGFAGLAGARALAALVSESPGFLAMLGSLGLRALARGRHHPRGWSDHRSRRSAMYLTQGLHRAVQQCPGEIATVCAGRTRTHVETVDRISRLAAGLRDLGIRDGARAAILALNSDRFHEFLGATLWAGGVLVPVNIRWAIAEIADSLIEVDARVLVVDDFFASYV